MSDHSSDSDFDDKTAIRQEPNDDKTSVREDAGREQKAESDVAETPSQEETVIRGKASSSPEKPKPKTDKPERQSATILRGSSRQGDSSTILREPGKQGDSATILREPGKPGQSSTVLREPKKRDHATILRGASKDGESATVLRSGDAPPQNDSTVMRDGGGGASESDATVINAGREDDSTVIGGHARGEADTTYVAAAGRPQQNRGNSEAGRLLKNRFVLEEKVGSGGMGDVYKALDLRQQEAQERNPYIAIKILNENFARHKDAFISLQREATRTRGIPHPNIMAVYDFDREGDTVFMSMELLDGKPLDDYLKEHPEGVSVEDAWNIIDGICQGLSRAHGAGIVHSDFKPGNIYYTATKIAKVFDFGIARAVSAPGDLKADGEKTVFDAGSLGALTPTYASLEMLTGKEPQKSDDVYAVALVAYELFTGRHPYNRTPADKALERGLEPEPVPFLKRRHWRALKKGLALKGEDRWQSIDEFTEGMFSEDPPYLRYAAIAAVLMVSMGFGAYSFFNVQEVPAELTELQGRISSERNNLIERFGKLDESPNPGSWKFGSSDWREQVRLSLSRLRGVTIELQEKWPDEWEKMGPDERPKIDEWKKRVLSAYLTTIASIRDDVFNKQVGEGTLEENKVAIEKLLQDLEDARTYLAEVEETLNFDAAAVEAQKSQLAAVLQSRQFQYQAIVADIAEQKAREEATQKAEEERIAREKFETERNATYLARLDEFKDIMRCKGELRPEQRAALAPILFGTPEAPGLKTIFPEQYEIDEPGIIAALRGCIEQRIGVRDPDQARDVKRQVMAMFPGEQSLANIAIEDLDPCAARNLEGKGASNGRWCSDRLAAGGTGPEMVVLPTAGGKEKLAISRIEIKVSDYNSFCEATGCTQFSGPGTIPVTNISLNQARAYTAWLSDQTGKHYRLPTSEEWLRAARTDHDEELDDNINCTVDSRGVRLGEKLLSTLSGRPNAWGLYNFVGNAREWAVEGDGVVAMGGAHTDPKSECTLEKKVAHTGNPDPVTGFRIIRPVEG